MAKKLGAPKPDDEIDLVSHSEGGIVSLLWLQRIFANDGDYHPEFKNNAKKLVTLSTPFWGSGRTVLGEFVRHHSLARELVGLNFGEQELEGLSFGSQTIWGLFKRVTDPGILKTELDLLHSIKILNIGASAINYFEDDGLVPLASARLGANVYNDLRTDYDEGDTLDDGKFVPSTLNPQYIAVRATHAVKLEPI